MPEAAAGHESGAVVQCGSPNAGQSFGKDDFATVYGRNRKKVFIFERPWQLDVGGGILASMVSGTHQRHEDRMSRDRRANAVDKA